MKRIYKEAPFLPETGYPDQGDVEVTNSRGRVLWYGHSEYDLDKWRESSPLLKSWKVKIRYFNEGYCIGCFTFSGDDYNARREAELAAYRYSQSPEGKAEMKATFARIVADVFGG